MMKKYFTYQNLFSLVLTILAITFGGGVMADATMPQVGDEAPEATAQNNANQKDPAEDGTAGDLYTPGDNANGGHDLTGSQMSSTQERKEGNIDDEWDSQTAVFHAFKTPMYSLVRKVTRIVNVKNWIVNHSRSGGDTLEAVTTANIAAGATVKLTRSNVAGNLLPFYKGTSILVPDIAGYIESGTSDVASGCLELFVVEVDKTGVTCQAVNGPRVDTTVPFGGNLDEMTCPAIPAGTKLLASASVGSESQLEITPENYHPSKYEVYLQKKLLNLLFTEDFKEVKKKQPHFFADVRADAIDKYKLRAERNYWLGNKKRFSVQMADGSIEDVYKSDGILNQVTYSYAIDNEYTLNDLIALSMLQFTNFSEHDHAFVFCGKNAAARLLNVDPGTNRHIEIVIEKMAGLDIEFHRFKDTFGTFDFCYCQTLDLLGMQDCMVVLDLEGATRYVKIGEKEQTNDLSKGQGARLAKRWIHYEADAIALRGYNSIIVGPAEKIYNLPANENRSAVVSAMALPATAATGTLVALKADYTSGGTTYSGGKVYEKTANGWEEWTGKTFAV